jgi:two-component system, NarL family, nitrate/nitrite response regulator NarL
MDRSVVLVDDHEGFRFEARAMLEADGYRVIGEASSAAGAVREAARLQPDIVLLDVVLPDGSGFDIVGPIRVAVPAVIVVLISSRRAGDYGERVTRSGADAFLDKARLTPGALRAALALRTLP